MKEIKFVRALYSTERFDFLSYSDIRKDRKCSEIE